MPGEKTVVMEWFYSTPCGHCGKDVQIGKDLSRGKKKFSASSTVRAKCTSCGHEDAYPASAINNRPAMQE